MVGTDNYASGIPIHPSECKAISLTPTLGSKQTLLRALITLGLIRIF